MSRKFLPFRRVAENLSHVRFKHVFELLARGVGDDEIMQTLRLKPHTFERVRTAYFGIYPDAIVDQIPNCDIQTRFLVDECMPYAATLPITRTYGHATHVDFLGISGIQDDGLYDFAIHHEYEAIFTFDKIAKAKDTFSSNELTLIAQAHSIATVLEGLRTRGRACYSDAQKLPMIIRFDCADKSADNLSGILDKHEAKIQNIIDDRPSPCITVTQKGVNLGFSHKKVFENFFAPKPEELADIFSHRKSEHAAVERAYERILKSRGNALSKRQKKILRKKVEGKLAAS